MASSKSQKNISNVLILLQEWDKGNKIERKKILTNFIDQNHNRTGAELEEEFAQAASLFFTRLTAWLRITYMVGTCLIELLTAINIFLSASSSHKFLSEFLEVGGILTLLETLSLKQAKEQAKASALICLQAIADSGRKYKELICESYGIRAIAECLANSNSEEVQDNAISVLRILANGNPRYHNQVYKGLIALLPCPSPKAQQLSCQTIRQIQPIIGEANPTIVDPLINLLRSLHLEVQYEAIELINDQMAYCTREEILKRLVEVLRPTTSDVLGTRPSIVNDADAEEEIKKPAIPAYIQQATSAKCIGVLSKTSKEVMLRLVELEVVQNLMYAMGNQDHHESQRQASQTLFHFVQKLDYIDEAVHEAMGEALYTQFMADPERLYLKLDHVGCDILSSNKVIFYKNKERHTFEDIS